MSEFTLTEASRRSFLRTVTAALGVRSAISLFQGSGLSLLAPEATSAAALPRSTAGAAPGYRCLNRDEAAFTEALVNVLCPADHLTPDGVTCGLASSIDRLLADEGIAVAQHFKAGVAAANTACQQRFGVRFDHLVASDADAFLHDIGAGRAGAADLPLDSWLNERVNQLLVQASFAEPIYDRYCNRVFWKIFGQAGGTNRA
jgi:gluconate 2-dehydrogenase gamma chain